MFFSLLLTTLSSVVQLIKAHGTKKSSPMVLVLLVFPLLSLCAHPLFMTPLPPLPCYLFGHVARLSSLETYARLSICFLKTLFKIASVVQKNRKNRVGWMKGIRGGQDVTVYIAKWQVICLHISRKFSCCCCSGSEGPLYMFHLSVLRFAFDKYASRRKLNKYMN